MSADHRRDREVIPERPLTLLRQQLQDLSGSEYYQFVDVHKLFAEAMFAVIVRNAADEGVTIRRRRGNAPLRVGQSSIRGVIEVELDPNQRPNLVDKPYDYLMVFLNNLFTSVTCLHYLLQEPDWENIFSLADDVLSKVDGFLQVARTKPNKIASAWKKLIAFASEQIERIFVGKMGWSQKKFRKRLVKIAAHTDPYLLVMPDFHDGPVSILTTMKGSDRFYLNIPTAVDQEVAVNQEDEAAARFRPKKGKKKKAVPLHDFPFCELSDDAKRVLEGLSKDIFPYWRLPVHNQAANVHARPLPRNTQLQLEGTVVRDEESGQVVGLEIDKQQLRIAAPKQKMSMRHALVNMLTQKVPAKRLDNATQLGQQYAEAGVAMGDAAWLRFFGFKPKHAFNNIISNFGPPEPEVIPGMRRVVITGDDGEKRFFYINFPLKDYGAPKVDIVFFIDGQWEYRSFVGANAFLTVLDLVARTQGLSEQYTKSFYHLVDLMEHYQELPDDADASEYHVSIRQRICFFMQKAMAMTAKDWSRAGYQAKINALLPWFYLLLLNYRYSPEKREKEAEVWKTLFQEVYQEFSGEAAAEFAWKWNVFTSMPMQPGVHSALFNLILMFQSLVAGWEGCKSAKDRGTEIKIFECFIEQVLFFCSRNDDNNYAHLKAALYHSAIHFKVCLQFFSHATGTMPCGSYSKINADAPESERRVLELLDMALKMLRKVNLKGKPAKKNLAVHRNKIFGNVATSFEVALKRRKSFLVLIGFFGVIALIVGAIDGGEKLALQASNATSVPAEMVPVITWLTAVAGVSGGLALLFVLIAFGYHVRALQLAPGGGQQKRNYKLTSVVVHHDFGSFDDVDPLNEVGGRPISLQPIPARTRRSRHGSGSVSAVTALDSRSGSESSSGYVSLRADGDGTPGRGRNWFLSV